MGIAEPIASVERKLYVVTRRDLDPVARAVMALHVAATAAYDLCLNVDRTEWTDYGPPILLMDVRNRERLEKLVLKYGMYTYSDPDLDDGICAAAVYALHWNDNWARIATL